MEYKRMSRCGIDNCKQTQFSLENGRWFCRNGHMREGELELAADDDGFGQAGARAGRAQVVTKRVHKVLRGRKGFELYLSCLQVLLQRQVHWLVQVRGFPAELEAVVRDLWALRLQIVAGMLPENVAASQMLEERAGGEEGYSSQSSYLYTSDSDGASTTKSGRRRRARRVPKAGDRPKLVESLALCYLGVLLLRCPASLGDFARWVQQGGLAYQRAIRQVPAAMREKLSAEYYTALEPMVRLRPGRLYTTVHSLVALLHERFGVTFPPVNQEVLVARAVNDLGLPLEVYTATHRLADRLFMTFEWPPLPAKRNVTHWPEAKLLALVITATKLCYGLDDLVRTPHSPTEPAATAIEWDAWETFLRAGNAARDGTLRARDPSKKALLEVDVTEADVFAMDGKDLDWYLDWYEETWCGEEEEEEKLKGRHKLSKGILNLFPTSRKPQFEQREPSEAQEPQRTLKDRIAELHAATSPVPHNPAESAQVVRPGEQYLWYSFDEEVPHRLRTLMQAAADLLGIERSDLQKAVRFVELQLKMQVKEKRRADRRAGEVSGEEAGKRGGVVVVVEGRGAEGVAEGGVVIVDA